MKALLLYNTASGRGRITRRLEDIKRLFAKAEIEIEAKSIDFEGNPFDGYEDVELVVVCGGDGTINFVVNKMRERGIDPTLGIIPAGTANDFASAIGMKHNILRAARQIANGTTRHVDLGEVNGRYFVNVLSFGVLTTTSQQTSDREKHLVGKLAYLHTGAKDLMTMHNIPLSIEHDGEVMKIDAAMFLAFNGHSAGQFKLAPDAKVDDGEFDILVLDYHNAVKTCWNMMHYMISHESKAVHYFRCKELEVRCEENERTDIDGQQGPSMPLKIRCIAGGLKIRA